MNRLDTIHSLFFSSVLLVGAASAVGACDTGGGSLGYGGESCMSGSECVSGECAGAPTQSPGAAPEGEGEGEGEGEDVVVAEDASSALGMCTEPPAAPPSSQAPSSSAHSCETTSGKTIDDGDLFCDKNVLYECIGGDKDKVRSCNSCDYVGAGTGSQYDTSCRSKEPASWPSNKTFAGPGCYFGYKRICK